MCVCVCVCVCVAFIWILRLGTPPSHHRCHHSLQSYLKMLHTVELLARPLMALYFQESLRIGYFILLIYLVFWPCSWGMRGLISLTSLVTQMLRNLPAIQETIIWSLRWEDPLEEGMAAHSSVLAWRIPWTEEPGGLQSMRSQRVRHDWATNTFTFRDRTHAPCIGSLES